MTDIHTHVLYDIDDGPPDIETSVQMLRLMYAQGVRNVVATPHFDYINVSPDSFIGIRDERMIKLREEAKKLGIRLLSGCELKLSPQLLQLESIAELCIEGTNYILIEMPFLKAWDEAVFENLINLSDYFNVTPIIAHVERYYPIIKNVKLARRLLDCGARLQLDADSINFKEYAKTVKKLLKYNLIDFVASDAHDTDERSPDVLMEAFAEIERAFGKGMASQLMMNADKIV